MEIAKILHRKALRLFLSCLADARHPTTGRHVANLEISGDYWTDTKLSLLLPHIRHLKGITIQNNTRITHTSFNHVPRHCPQLAIIFLYSEKPITEQTILRIPDHCRQLQTLKLTKCPRLTDDTFVALGQQCPLVTFLFDFADPSFWTVTMLEALRQWQLNQLVLTSLPAIYAKHLLMPLDSGQTLYPWPKLQRLYLDDCAEIDDETLVPFLQAHRRLTGLRLTGGGLFTDEAIDTMATACPHLTMLHIFDNHFITSAAIRRLVCRCRRLTTLLLSRCSRIAVGDFPENEVHTNVILLIETKGLVTIRRAAAQ
ncbi:unnamed protein product [Absidia cylindrospora]